MTNKTHDARNIPLADRVAYATVVGSMAAADDVVDTAELEKLAALCAALGLPADETERVKLAAQSHHPDEARAALERLANVDLRFTLYTDCLLLAYADDQVAPQERTALADIAATLRITDEQAAALEDYVKVAHDAVKPGADHDELKRRSAGVADKLAAVGVPAGALALGSAAFLGVSGIATGLAAVGLGLGIASGFGAVVGLGVGTAYGVRWLHHKLADKSHGPAPKRYQDQDSTMTLREGFEEFRSGFEGLVTEDKMQSDKAKDMFLHHDRCHVIFGCDTTPGNEAMVDTWSIFGTDVSVKAYAEYSKLPEVQGILKETGFMRMLLESMKASPKAFEAFMHARAMHRKWPFFGGEEYLDTPLKQIREQFGIKLV